jgi:hypothetical protein
MIARNFRRASIRCQALKPIAGLCVFWSIARMLDPPTPVERRYRKGVPRKVPKGRVLVHNEVIAKRERKHP